MSDNELDLLLKEKIDQIQVPKKLDKDIKSVIYKKILNRRNNYLKYVASIVIFLVVILSVIFVNIKYNKLNTDENVNNDVQVDNLYGVINVNKENNNALSYRYDIDTTDLKTIFESLDYDVVIAKVESISYTNYDTIIKNIRGDFKVDETLTVKANGGILEYNQYMRYWNYYNMKPLDIDRIEKEYTDYINAGKEEVYISEFGENDIRLEEGKTYMMFIRKMAGNEYFTNLSKNLLREYDENTGMILNNDTKEYQDINSVLY